MKPLAPSVAKLMLLLAITCPFWINTTLANSLYQADIEYSSPTANITLEQQQQLIKQAFSQLLIKLYGNVQITYHPDYAEILQQAPNLLEKYSFTHQNADDKTKKNTAEDKQEPINDENLAENLPDETASDEIINKIFHASFSPAGTDKLLKAKQLSVWHGARPDTLVWLTIEENGGRTTVSNENHPELLQQMRKIAHKRGLDLVFPMLDLNDQQYVSTSDLWGNFSTAIIAASKRYHTPAILNIRTYRENNAFWQINSHLYLQGKQINWQETSDNLSQMSELNVDRLLGHLADIFKLNSQSELKQRLVLQIHNVVSYKDYQRLEQYLSKVSVINTFQLVRLAQDKIMFTIEFIGNKQFLLRTLTLDEFLQDFSHSVQHQKSSIDLQQTDYSEVNLVNPDDLTPQENKEKSNIDNAKPENQSNAKKEKNLNNNTDKELALSAEKAPLPLHPIPLKPDMELWLRD